VDLLGNNRIIKTLGNIVFRLLETWRSTAGRCGAHLDEDIFFALAGAFEDAGRPWSGCVSRGVESVARGPS